MVARDPVENKAAIVNRLHARNSEEKNILELSRNHQALRKSMSDESLLKTIPNESERSLIHKIFIDTSLQVCNTCPLLLLLSVLYYYYLYYITTICIILLLSLLYYYYLYYITTICIILLLSVLYYYYLYYITTICTILLILLDTIWMEDAMLKTVRICFPEQKNIYNKIFGGFLMRQAFELAWANACVYSKSRYSSIYSVL